MTYRPLPFFGAAIAALIASLPASPARAQIVEVTTPLGLIYWELLPGDAPATVANLLNYIDDGDYDDSFVHRSAFANYSEDPQNPDFLPFVIQGGGFFMNDSNQVNAVPTDPPIINEPGVSNLRGTVAMARSSGVDSATSQWFINMNDNDGFPASLDTQNEGFTVFANVVAGMDVADAIAALAILDLTGGNPNSPFGTVPVLDSYEPNTVEQDELVLTAFRVVLPGDTDGDGDIDDTDLGTLFANYTGPVGDVGGKVFIDGDTDFDGDVDDIDLGTAFANYTGPLSPASVPEPASAALLGLGVLALVRRRRA